MATRINGLLTLTRLYPNLKTNGRDHVMVGSAGLDKGIIRISVFWWDVRKQGTACQGTSCLGPKPYAYRV